MTKTLRPSRIRKKTWLVASLFGLAAVMIIGGLARQSRAAGSIGISDIRVTESTPTHVDISWTTDVAADSAVRYGQPGTGLPDRIDSSTEATTHTLRLEPLTPSTPYEFQVGSKLGTEDEADRTWAPEPPGTESFATPPGSSGGDEPPTLTSLLVNPNCCRANFIFSTDPGPAVGYTLTLRGPGIADSVSESAPGTYQQDWQVQYPDVFSPGGTLTASSQYEYTVSIRDSAGNSRSYGPFVFTTGRDEFDYTFIPGQCRDGTLIGHCNLETGEYCGPGGLVLNCVLCGFECQINETCRSGGACTEDPGSGESAYQCNPQTCYTSACIGGSRDGAPCVQNSDCTGGGSCSGETFITPAGPGCYRSWRKCNANTILKVQKDRICNKWMTCRTQTDIKNPTTNQTESLCYDLAACAALGADGQCAKPLFGKFCNDDPLRFCETSADCDGLLCKPASGKWCSAAKLLPSGLREYLPCVDDAQCAFQGLPDARCIEFTPENVTYSTPTDIQKIRNLSGSINAGLSWTTGPTYLVEGMFPWYYMPQTGSVVSIGNGHFEETATVTSYSAEGVKTSKTEYTTKPWSAFGSRGSDNAEPLVSVVPEDSGNQNNPNHVLKIDPTDADGTCQGGSDDGTSCSSASDCQGGGICKPHVFTGAQAPNQTFSTVQNASYILSFRAKSSTPSGQTVVARFYPPPGGTAVPTPIVTTTLTSDWQTFISEPIDFVGGGSAWLQFVRTDGSTDAFFIDDVELNVALGIRAQASAVEYVPRSCRLYPREDSLLCEYKDSSGIRYKGWYGYCLERDAKYADRCLSWWPVDIIGGESDVFGTFGSEATAGYHDRTPLYYCLEAKGVTGKDTTTYTKKDTSVEPFACTDIHTLETQQSNVRFGTTPIKGYFRSEASDGDYCTRSINHYDCFAEVHNPIIAGCNDWVMFDHEIFPVNAEDRYSKFELDSVVIREIAPSHTDWNFDPQVLNEANNWSVNVPLDGNRLDFIVHFDDHDRVESLEIFANDESSSDGGFAAVVEYHFNREMCTKVVQVADDQGTNRAWSGRVAVGSGYKTRVTNYGFTDDLAPFGGAVSSAADPADWLNPLYVEAPRTTGTYVFPYQTRAGLPAACKGDCSSRTCLGGGTKEGMVCRTAEDCRDSDGNQGVCMGVGVCTRTLKACSGNRNQAGLCIKRDGTTDSTGEACCSAEDPNDYCLGGAASNAGAQVYSLDDNGKWQCKLSGAWCKCATVPGVPPGDTCADPANMDGDVLCATYIDGDTCESVAIPSIDEGAFGIDNLKRLFAQSYGFWTWSPKLSRYVKQTKATDWTPPSFACQTCSSSGHACTEDDDCPTGIEGSNICQVSGQRGKYNDASLLGKSADFCGNRPRAFGFRVNDQTKPIDIVDGGWVNLKFNTAADGEQLPLSSLLVNWSDGQQQSVYFPYAPRSSLDSPHVMSHRYFCSSPQITGDTPLPDCTADSKSRLYPCKQGGSCVYQPRVIVEDNWGWCNGVGKLFWTYPDCSEESCADGFICDPQYQVCISKVEYVNLSCAKSDVNFPPSWQDTNGVFDSDKPIEVRVKPVGTS